MLNQVIQEVDGKAQSILGMVIREHFPEYFLHVDAKVGHDKA